MPEVFVGSVVQMYVEMFGGDGDVGGRSELSTKIRKIRHIGCLLLPAFFRWCAFWSNCFCNSQFRSSLGG